MFRLELFLWTAVLSLGACVAQAADIHIQGPRFTPWHSVPHVHLSGSIEEGDSERLANALSEACVRYDCPEFNNTLAVLSLNSPGGNFHEGIKLAEQIRNAKVATIVRTGDRCYSACAVAWLGGSGFHLTGGVGTYIDRYVEPGATLGFHSPFLSDDAQKHPTPSERAQAQADGLRLGIAEMVRVLVRYAVSPELVDRLIQMGPNETYDVATVADLVLLKAELPPQSLTGFGLRTEEVVWNACHNLLALHYQMAFGTRLPLIAGYSLDRMALADGNVLQGYEVNDRPLNVSFCGTPRPIDINANEFSIHLARMAWKEDSSEVYADPIISLNFSSSGWNSAGYRGGRASASHLRLTPILSWLLPPNMAIVDVPRLKRSDTIPDAFAALRSPNLPARGDGARRDYAIGAVEVTALVGGPELVHMARQIRSRISDTEITYERRFADAYVFSGFVNAARTQGFYRFVINNADRTAFFDLSFPMTVDGEPYADAGDTVTMIACGTTFFGAGLPCAKR